MTGPLERLIYILYANWPQTVKCSSMLEFHLVFNEMTDEGGKWGYTMVQRRDLLLVCF